MDPPQLVLQRDARDRIERAERLVEQQDPRLGRQRARHADALPLAARELIRDSDRDTSPRAARPARAARRPGARDSLRRPSRAAAAPSRRCRRPSGAAGARPAGSRSRCVRRSATGSTPRTSRRRRGPSPSSGSISRLIILTSVVLPLPDSPSTTISSPSRCAASSRGQPRSGCRGSAWTLQADRSRAPASSLGLARGWGGWYVYSHGRTPEDRLSPKRVRAFLGGIAIADTMRARLVWEQPHYPVYYLPIADVRMALVPPDACKLFADSPVAELRDLVRIQWNAMDSWFEEEDEVFVHPHDPYKRIDILASFSSRDRGARWRAARGDAPADAAVRD